MGRRDLSLVESGRGYMLDPGCYDVGLLGWVGDHGGLACDALEMSS